jgi:hypothetical protein
LYRVLVRFAHYISAPLITTMIIAIAVGTTATPPAGIPADECPFPSTFSF